MVGYQRVRGDLVTWARGRPIRRDDLLAFLLRRQVEQRQVGEEDRMASPVTDPAVQFTADTRQAGRGQGLGHG